MIVDRSELPEEFDVAALDGDIVQYRSAFSAEKVYWTLYDSEGNFVERFENAKSSDNHLSELSDFLGVDTTGHYREPERVISDVEHAINACDTIMAHIKRKVPSKEYKVYLNGKNNYREQIAKTAGYKANRKDTAKPVHHEAVKQHLIKEYGAVVVDGNETDDAIGVCMYLGYLGKKKTCGVSIDKDILNVPGAYYHFIDDDFYLVSEEEANDFLWQQILTGDKVDNIMNVGVLSKEFKTKHGLANRKGFGPVTAQQLLSKCTSEKEKFEIVKEAFQDTCGDGWRERMNENGKLVFIQRQKGKIWDVSWHE